MLFVFCFLLLFFFLVVFICLILYTTHSLEHLDNNKICLTVQPLERAQQKRQVQSKICKQLSSLVKKKTYKSNHYFKNVSCTAWIHVIFNQFVLHVVFGTDARQYKYTVHDQQYKGQKLQ